MSVVHEKRLGSEAILDLFSVSVLNRELFGYAREKFLSFCLLFEKEH